MAACADLPVSLVLVELPVVVAAPVLDQLADDAREGEREEHDPRHPGEHSRMQADRGTPPGSAKVRSLDWSP